MRIGKLALVGGEVTLKILLRDEAARDQFFPNIQDEIAKDGPSAVAGWVRLGYTGAHELFPDLQARLASYGNHVPPILRSVGFIVLRLWR